MVAHDRREFARVRSVPGFQELGQESQESKGVDRGSDSTRCLLDIVARPICQDGARDNVKEMIGPWRV